MIMCQVYMLCYGMRKGKGRIRERGTKEQEREEVLGNKKKNKIK